jgi:hypothetical protein
MIHKVIVSLVEQLNCLPKSVLAFTLLLLSWRLCMMNSAWKDAVKLLSGYSSSQLRIIQKGLTLLCGVILILTTDACNRYDNITEVTTPNGAITGFIFPVDYMGRPVSDKSGITVSLEGTSISAKSDQTGKWTLSNVPAGVYTISFSKSDYSTNKVVAYQFVGNGTAFIPATYIPQEPPFKSNIDSVVFVNNDSDTLVTLSYSLSGAPQNYSRALTIYMHSQPDISSVPSKFTTFTTGFMSTNSTTGSLTIPLQSLLDMGFERKKELYFRCYANSRTTYRYTDIATGRLVVSGIESNPSSARMLTLP